MTKDHLLNISAGALASVGDSVYDLFVRTELVRGGALRMGDLHRKRVALVNARAQARAAALLPPLLSEEEAAVFRRGRNTELHSIPPAATRAEYHAATALETLLGWLHLKGEEKRLRELLCYIQQNWEE